MTPATGNAVNLDALARSQFGWDRLTDDQRTAMRAVLQGRDLLAVLPTGSGKSAIYQVPSLLTAGATLVVSPLIALQDDQIATIEESGAGSAVAINARLRAGERRHSWRAIEDQHADFIFVSPEQLASADVVDRLRKAGLSLIVVDEAHCVSAWGQDFRPDYRRLADVFRTLGDSIPVVALTATASAVVRRDIVDQLGLHTPEVVVGGFDRPNLRLTVERHIGPEDKRSAVIDSVSRQSGPGLLYTATRKDAEDYAHALQNRGLTAAVYHAGMKTADRDAVHVGFRDDRYDVVVATSAFGMGIDKPDVRFVAHASVPESLDNYYQQIGRAGRDGKDAVTLLFYRPEDLGLARFFSTGRPDEKLLATVYAALSKARPTKLKELRNHLGIGGRKLTNAINLLDEVGSIQASRNGFRCCAASPEAAVAAAIRLAELRERVDISRIEMMRGYAETDCCRRAFLLSYFGEQLRTACGNCDICLTASRLCDVSMKEPAIPVDTEVRHREWGFGTVIGGDADRVTVLFDQYGYRVLSMAAIRTHGLLDVAPARG